MALNIPEKKIGQSIISASGDTVVLKGEINDINPDIFLSPFFDKILKSMGSTLTIDVSDLDFINSSGIKSLVVFIMKRPSSKIIIQSDTSKSWQKTSLKILQSLDEKNIQLIEI